jgi:tetratricopeptide (TPR) repeat protein
LAHELGQCDQAITRFLEAQSSWRSLEPATVPLESSAWGTAWGIHWELAKLYDQTGRPADAIPHYVVWRDMRAEEYRANPGDAIAATRLAEVCFDLGLARKQLGQLDLALRDLREASGLWERQTSDSSRTRYRALARVSVEIGRVLDDQSRFAEAIDAHRTAIKWHLLAWDTSDPRRRHSESTCAHVIGNLHCDLRQYREAVASYRRALALRESLANEFPGNAKYVSDRDGTRRRLGEALEQLKSSGISEPST